MTATGVGYGDSAGRKRRGLSAPGELGVYGDLTLWIFLESTRFLHSGYSRSLRGFLHSGYSRNLLGFCTPDVLGVYEVSTLRIFSETTRILHSGVYYDSKVGAPGRDAPRGCETKHAPLICFEKA